MRIDIIWDLLRHWAFLNPKLLRSCVFLPRLFDCRSFWQESGPTNSWPVTPDIECDLRRPDTRDWSRNWPWSWAGSRPGTWVGMTEWLETTAKRLGENDQFPAFSQRKNTFSVVELWPHTGECRLVQSTLTKPPALFAHLHVSPQLVVGMVN